jgi:hypothetical protein
LPPPKGDFDPDGSWKDSDKDAFNFHFKSFLDDLNEEPDETEPDGYSSPELLPIGIRDDRRRRNSGRCK